VRARLAWFLGAIGLAGLVAYLRRRSKPAPAAPDAQADELRKTLEESRATADQLEQPATGEVPAEPESGGVEARRKDVHDRGRSALDEMEPPGSGSE
jgi:hypothetical protein